MFQDFDEPNSTDPDVERLKNRIVVDAFNQLPRIRGGAST